MFEDAAAGQQVRRVGGTPGGFMIETLSLIWKVGGEARHGMSLVAISGFFIEREYMNVSAELTRRDLLVVSFQLLLGSRANLWFMLVVGCGVFAWQWFKREPDSAALVLLLLLGSAITAVGALLGAIFGNVVCMLLSVGRRRGVLGMHRFSISPAGLHEATEFNDSHHAWLGVDAILKLRNHAGIMMSQGTHILPRSAFASHADYEDFFEQARTWKDAARALQPAPAAR